MTPPATAPTPVVPRNTPGGPERSRVQDLAGAVLAGADTEDVLELLLSSARSDLSARSALLVMPVQEDLWSIELVAGKDSASMLGLEIDPAGALGLALTAADPEGIEVIGDLPTGTEGEHRPALVAAVDAGEHGVGALAVLHASKHGTFSPADRERLDALAGLVGIALRVPDMGGDPELDDERRRIARDLHDLAIQELFAVGMELESLTEALSTTGEPPTNARLRSSVATSVQGVENAVTQIRQIVQSLRRERVEATLAERLRHEVGLATSGLGFVPGLRMPPHPPDLDEELPPEIAEDVVAVVREGLANAARHAHASAVAVSVSVFSEGVDRVVQVNVSDNGRGIDPGVSRRSGLANMSSRARRHAGWVDAFNLEPGTMISWRVTLPIVA